MLSEDDISPTLSPFETLFIRQLDLESELDLNEKIDQVDGNVLTQNDEYYKNLVFKYLNAVTKKNDTKVNDHFKDLYWLNVSKTLSLSNDLQGLIVVCDFFTYCCINCLHILPYLSQLEKKYNNEQIQIIGIHSPKFDNEKSFQNLADAILRYNILHPVCNDTELKLWNHLSINCWPTIAVIGPDSELLFLLVGEKAIENRLQFYLDLCLQYYQKPNKLLTNKSLLPISFLKDSVNSDLLYYPTKVAISPSNTKIAIANTLKHSIIVTDFNGLTENIIGSNNANLSGFDDGSLEKSLFNCPQGLTWQNDEVLFVCDTENHAIRKIDFNSNLVQTVAGHGSTCSDISGGQIGKAQGLNSPWDLIFDSTKQRLYIAMAGSHQIWLIILSSDGDLVNGTEYPYLTCVCFAGDGNEQKRNNRFPLKSSFAQPSGISLKNGRLYVADSESSSIRVIDIDSGCVTTIVGGNVNPLDLFAFGDIDGIGLKCRLQHCMGVCADNEDFVYIADTFNHKIKKISIDTKKCQTLQLNWKKDEFSANQSLNEPNGLCFHSVNLGKQLLVCDTNNHRILSIDLTTEIVSNFNIYHVENKLTQLRISDSSKDDIIEIFEESANVFTNQNLLLDLHFNFIKNLKAESGAKHKIKISSKELTDHLIISPSSITTTALNDVTFEIKILKNEPFSTTFLLQCDLNLCNEQLNYCKFLRICIEQPVQFKSNISSDCEPMRKRILITV